MFAASRRSLAAPSKHTLGFAYTRANVDAHCLGRTPSAWKLPHLFNLGGGDWQFKLEGLKTVEPTTYTRNSKYEEQELEK